MRHYRFFGLSLLACAALATTATTPRALAITPATSPVTSGSEGCGCWDLYWGLRADCDRRYQNYLDTCNGMPEPDRSHCYNGAEYWRDVCYQDAWWEFEGCIRSCGSFANR